MTTMTKTEKTPLLWTWEDLKAAHEGTQPYGGRSRRKLPLRSVKTVPGVFQHRVHEAWDNASQRHVQELKRVLKEGRDLEPILVLPVGPVFVVLDGHHRLDAYRNTMGKTSIPAEVHLGSLEEALKLSLAGNSQDKLPMTKEGKYEGAWRLVLHTKLSKKDTADTAGVSDGLVATMRRKRSGILEAGGDPSSMTWKEALNWGREKLEYTEEDLEAQVADWVERLRKTFGTAPLTNPEAFLRALEVYSPNVVRRMVDLLEDWSFDRDGDEDAGDF